MIGEFLARLGQRVVWSWEGVTAAARSERSFRQWLWLNGASILLALVLPLPGGARGLVIALGGLVLASELMNTAVERIVDLVTQERHPLAKQAKDVASGAVMVVALSWGMAWLSVVWGLWTG